MQRLSSAQLNDIEALLSVSTAPLEAIRTSLEGTHSLLSYDEIQELLSTGLDESASEALLRLCSSISYRSDQSTKAIDEVIGSILESLRLEDSFSEKLNEASAALAVVGAICRTPSIYASFKASRISGLLDRHIHQVLLVVGARPIFHPDRESVFAMEVHANVSLVVSDAAEKEEHLTFRISLKEIEELERKCSEAKKKIDVLQGMLESVVPTRVRS